MNKREFVRTLGGASLGMIFGSDLWASHAAQPAAALAADEAFWAEIRRHYRLTPDYISLEGRAAERAASASVVTAMLGPHNRPPGNEDEEVPPISAHLRSSFGTLRWGMFLAE